MSGIGHRQGHWNKKQRLDSKHLDEGTRTGLATQYRNAHSLKSLVSDQMVENPWRELEEKLFGKNSSVADSVMTTVADMPSHAAVCNGNVVTSRHHQPPYVHDTRIEADSQQRVVVDGKLALHIKTQQAPVLVTPDTLNMENQLSIGQQDASIEQGRCSSEGAYDRPWH